jgi:hypothetical protein
MTETKRQRRRRNLLADHWLKMHGNPADPKSRLRNGRKHMRVRS